MFLLAVEIAIFIHFKCFHSLKINGILFWGNADEVNKIIVLQNRVVKAIYKLGFRVYLIDKFKEIRNKHSYISVTVYFCKSTFFFGK